jgi:hypothetical protein
VTDAIKLPDKPNATGIYPDIADFKTHGNIGPYRLLIRRWPTKPISETIATPDIHGVPMDTAWIVQVGTGPGRMRYNPGDAIMYPHHAIEDIRGFGQFDDKREIYGILMAKDVLMHCPAAKLSTASQMPKE